MEERFLTVYAVLDEETQKELTQLQSDILKNYPQGKQTMGIPFHISLGSFPLSARDDIIRRIGKSVEENPSFSIELQNLGHFNHQVIFVEPKINEALVKLQKQFEGNFADKFPWHPHVTLYIGEERAGKEILKKYFFEKKTASVVGLELGEFFPTKIIMNCSLRKSKVNKE